MELEKVDTLEKDLTKILEYQEDGYLFHGSRTDNIERLEPQRSYDVDSTNTFNNDTAVFASSNPQSCIFALLDREKMPEEMQKGTVIVRNRGNSLLAEIPLRWKKYIENNVGTLYVVPPDGFITEGGGSWQYKNREPVVPVDKISVSFEHFLRLGGKVIWKEE